MRLYQLRTAVVTGEFSKQFLLGLLVANSDEEVYGYLDSPERFVDGWALDADLSRGEIITAKGDLETERRSMFYEQKFGWKDLGEVSEADVGVLKRLNLLLNNDSYHGEEVIHG